MDVQNTDVQDIPEQFLERFQEAFERNYQTAEHRLHLLGTLEMKSQVTMLALLTFLEIQA